MDKSIRNDKNSSLFRSIFEYSFDAILLTVPEGQILAANPAACKMFGRSEEEICSVGRDGIVDPTYEGLRPALESRSEKGEFTGVIRYVRKDGTQFMGEMSSKVFLDENGEVRTAMIIRDITDRIAAENELKRREALLSLFVTHAPAAIAMFDINMNYIAVSKRFLKDYGLPDQDIIGKSHYDVFPELPEAWKVIHKRCLKGAVEKAEAEAFMRQDGSVDWINWEIHPWTNPDGEIGGLLLFSEDLTDFINLQNELKASEQRWRFALEGAGEGVWDWNCVTNEVYYSKQWKTMFEYEEDEVVPALRSWRRMILPEDDDLFRDLYEGLLKGNNLEFRREHQVRTKHGNLKWVLNRGMALGKSPDGGPLRVIGTITDITEIKKVQETLRENNRMLRLLSECNNVLVKSEDEQSLLSGICEKLVDDGKYTLAWVGMMRSDAFRSIEPVAQAGAGQAFVDQLKIKMKDPDHPQDEVPLVTAVQYGRMEVVQDISTDPRTARFKELAANFGLSSAVAVPLFDGKVTIGAIAIYSNKAGAFLPDEIKVIQEIANNLAYGITDLRLQMQHKMINRALINSENRYRTLFESSSEGIFIIEIKTGKIKFVNPTICRMLGYDREDLLRRTMDGLFHASEWDAVMREIYDHFEGLKTQSADIRLRTREGHELHMDLNSGKTVIDGAEVLVVFASDITERIAANEERENYANKILRAMVKTVELLSKTVELKDPYTAGHQLRVASLAGAIARALGVSDEEAEGIRMAAIVHDLGKMYVPSEIMSKPGRLNNLEFDLVKTHPQAGCDILKEVDFPWPIAEMVLQHHERINGTGYPNGILGAEMNLGARIIAVADVVESMASHRPYKPSLGIEAALGEIRAHSGTLFDAAVVEACVDLFEHGYVLEQV